MTGSAQRSGRMWRIAHLFSPSREHSMVSAAFLLMIAMVFSRIVGYLRDAYVAYAFGAGPVTDAFVSAFTLPDLVNHLASGGAISISFISIYTRYITANRQAEAREAFSVIVTVLMVGMGVLIVIGELFAPHFVRFMFPDFTAEQAELCIRLTRILLPAQLFFVVGFVVAAVQQTRRQFFIPALAPIVYTAFIIGGGVLLSARIGIDSLAVGALAGSFAGPFLLNTLGASGTGIGYRFRFRPFDPAFKEWFWMSIPLMLGVSIIIADDWIMRYFASGGEGAITRINYAKRLLQVPVGILGQAVGVASLPFFARLFAEKKFSEFAASVNSSITRLASVTLLVSALMIAAATPIVDIAFRRGAFTQADTAETAIFFSWFSLALVFWAVQGLYARAFYAAGQMARPMIAATIITVCSIPIYWACNVRWGITGLAVASNVAIFAHTATLALLLHARGMVKLSELGWRELTKATGTAVVAFTVSHLAGNSIESGTGLWPMVSRLAFITLTWGAAVAAGLWLTRSSLLHILRRA